MYISKNVGFLTYWKNWWKMVAGCFLVVREQRPLSPNHGREWPLLASLKAASNHFSLLKKASKKNKKNTDRSLNLIEMELSSYHTVPCLKSHGETLYLLKPLLALNHPAIINWNTVTALKCTEFQPKNWTHLLGTSCLYAQSLKVRTNRASQTAAVTVSAVSDHYPLNPPCKREGGFKEFFSFFPQLAAGGKKEKK